MATLNFPSITPSTINFGIRYNTQINVSSLSGSVQTIEIPGARWVATVSFDSMEPVEGRVMAAFLTELRGASGRFYLTDYSHLNPRGSNLAAGTVTINGASQTGSSVNTSGWDINETGLLLAGDYIELDGTELKMVTSSVDSDGSGNATINFEPPIRTSPGDATIVIRASCRSIMLLDDDESRWNINNAGLLSNITFSCTEGF